MEETAWSSQNLKTKKPESRKLHRTMVANIGTMVHWSPLLNSKLPIYSVGFYWPDKAYLLQSHELDSSWSVKLSVFTPTPLDLGSPQVYGTLLGVSVRTHTLTGKDPSWGLMVPRHGWETWIELKGKMEKPTLLAFPSSCFLACNGMKSIPPYPSCHDGLNHLKAPGTSHSKSFFH